MAEQLKRQHTMHPHTPTIHETAVEMQKHYERTGAYRAQDLTTVLGDPRVSVSGVVSSGQHASRRAINWAMNTGVGGTLASSKF